MANFAKIENGIVKDIIVIDNSDCGGGNFPESEKIGQEFIRSLGIKGEWLQTSVNTHMGVHIENGKAFRKNCAMIGGTYDKKRDAFIPINPNNVDSKTPFGKWKLDEETCVWKKIN
jgi:hypothetical protein